MSPLPPDELRTLIGEYLLGLLDEAQAKEIRELIEQDSEAEKTGPAMAATFS